MKKIALKTKVDVLKLSEKISYGQTYLSCDVPELRDFLDKYVFFINKIHGENTARIADGGEIEGFFRLIWSDRTQKPEILTSEDLKLQENLTLSIQNNAVVSFDLNPKLEKYARKISRSEGVKFEKTSTGEWSFNAKEKPLSAMKIIQNAFDNGSESVELNRSSCNPQTIRVYASQMAKFSGKKVSVSVLDDVIKVSFKDKKSYYYEEQFESLYNTMCRNIGKQEAVNIIRAYVSEVDFLEAGENEEDYNYSIE